MKTLKDRRLARKQFGGDGAAVNMKKAAEKILDRVITDNLRQKAAAEAVNLSKEKEPENQEQHKEEEVLQDKQPAADKRSVESKKTKEAILSLNDPQVLSELSSEINMDYQSDDVQQITELLIDKFRPLLDENDLSPNQFRDLSLTEQFAKIEDLQRLRRERKHEQLYEQNDRNDLLSFSQTQISNFVKMAAEKQQTRQVLIDKSVKANGQQLGRNKQAP